MKQHPKRCSGASTLGRIATSASRRDSVKNALATTISSVISAALGTAGTTARASRPPHASHGGRWRLPSREPARLRVCAALGRRRSADRKRRDHASRGSGAQLELGAARRHVRARAVTGVAEFHRDRAAQDLQPMAVPSRDRRSGAKLCTSAGARSIRTRRTAARRLGVSAWRRLHDRRRLLLHESPAGPRPRALRSRTFRLSRATCGVSPRALRCAMPCDRKEC